MSELDSPPRSGPSARPPGVLPLLRAFVDQSRHFDINDLDETGVETALNGGAGPILAYVTAEAASLEHSPHGKSIRAADLTMRIMTAVILESLEEVIAAAHEAGFDLMLLKGCSTGLRYYPEPHLRTMGDVDVLVSEEQRRPLESRLRMLGFEQHAQKPAAAYARHHHSMPFWHPIRGVWIEVHTRPYPPHSPLANAGRFSYDAVTSHPVSIDVGGQSALAMTHERQLVYTATRWAEMLDPERGMFPILDAALLLRSQRGRLDWDEVCRLADEPWAGSALRLMLTYLDRWHLASIPARVSNTLHDRDRFTNEFVRRILHRLVTVHVMEGRRPGSLLTTGNRRIIWSTLTRSRSPWMKLLALPGNLAFPPADKDRFDLSNAVRRVRSFVQSGRR